MAAILKSKMALTKKSRSYVCRPFLRVDGTRQLCAKFHTFIHALNNFNENLWSEKGLIKIYFIPGI